MEDAPTLDNDAVAGNIQMTALVDVAMELDLQRFASIHALSGEQETTRPSMVKRLLVSGDQGGSNHGKSPSRSCNSGATRF